jgi:hypothetical protein
MRRRPTLKKHPRETDCLIRFAILHMWSMLSIKRHVPNMPKPPTPEDLAPPVIAPQERHDPVVRRRFSAPAMRTFLNIAHAWDLTVDQQRALLGWPAASTFHKYKAGQVGTLSFDILTRISLVLGIYKALHILYPDKELADRWLKLPNSNPLFGGKPALTRLTQGDIDALYQVRRLLDSRRGGWN